MDTTERRFTADKSVAYVLIGIIALVVCMPIVLAILIFLPNNDGTQRIDGAFFLLGFAGFTYWMISWRFKYIECAFSNIPMLEFDEETISIHGISYSWSELVWLRSKIGYDPTMRNAKMCNMEFRFSNGHYLKMNSKNLADAEDMEYAVEIAYNRYCEFHPEVKRADVIFKKWSFIRIYHRGLRTLFLSFI